MNIIHQISRSLPVTAVVVLVSCASQQAAPVDPACVQGMELMETAESDQEMKKVRSLFQTSCEQGHGTGCFHLALMWERGMGGLEDQDFAMQLLRRSCDLGESQACSVLHSRLKMQGWESGQNTGMPAGWP